MSYTTLIPERSRTEKMEGLKVITRYFEIDNEYEQKLQVLIGLEKKRNVVISRQSYSIYILLYRLFTPVKNDKAKNIQYGMAPKQMK